jgi:hypothetical protein
MFSEIVGTLDDGQVINALGEHQCKMNGFTNWVEVEFQNQQKKTTGFVARMYLKPLEG